MLLCFSIESCGKYSQSEGFLNFNFNLRLSGCSPKYRYFHSSDWKIKMENTKYSWEEKYKLIETQKNVEPRSQPKGALHAAAHVAAYFGKAESASSQTHSDSAHTDTRISNMLVSYLFPVNRL